MTYRVLVTASRDWDDYDMMDFVLGSAVAAHMPDVLIVHGNYGDGDMMADSWACARGILTEPHDPDWARYSRQAGPIRNAEMVRAGADICVAFIRNSSFGATGCSNLASAAKIRTLRYRDGDSPAKLPPGPSLGD